MCRSGRTGSIGNRIWQQCHHRFESCHLRMYYVYFLRLRNGDIYTGVAQDLKRRIREHKIGKVESTSKYLPCILFGYEAYLDKKDAWRREKYLKTTEGKRFFNQQYKEILGRLGSSRHSTGRHVA